VRKLLRWIARIGEALRPSYFSRPMRHPSHVADETAAVSAVDAKSRVAEEIAPASAVAESGIADELAAVSAVAEDHATATDEVESQVIVTSAISADPQEIQRRRKLVRALFNDFWSGSDDKPATFADRLNQAEAHLNERLSAHGESWQLDANTRKMLGLPPRAN
jgi:hypothetical protein